MYTSVGSTRASLRPTTGFLEWEDTPSFADSLSHRLQWVGSAVARPAAPRLLTLRRLLREVGPQLLADAMRLSADVSARPSHGDTVPSALDRLTPSTPFSEPLHGLAVREVSDADVFRHFFG
jgi:hypothetical protein